MVLRSAGELAAALFPEAFVLAAFAFEFAFEFAFAALSFEFAFAALAFEA